MQQDEVKEEVGLLQVGWPQVERGRKKRLFQRGEVECKRKEEEVDAHPSQQPLPSPSRIKPSASLLYSSCIILGQLGFTVFEGCVVLGETE